MKVPKLCTTMMHGYCDHEQINVGELIPSREKKLRKLGARTQMADIGMHEFRVLHDTWDQGMYVHAWRKIYR